jgi:predicted helicase
MTNDFLSIIKNASTWLDVYGELSKQNTGRNPAVGKLFEKFCKYYYLLDPLVKNEYRNVWLFSEIPQNIKTRLNLGKVDHGIDLVLEGVDGTLSVVQCKFRNNQSSNISWTKDNLANLFADGDKADYFIVFTNASGLDKHSLTKKENQLKLVTLGDLLDIPSSTFNKIKNHLAGTNNIPVTKKGPREYQFTAIQAVVDGFKQNDRGQLILPCGAGKTLVSLWIKEALNVDHTLVLIPSLALLRQIKNEWTINSERFIPYICVCSETDIDKGTDQQIVHTYEISGKVSTNASEVREFLNSHSETIVYSTYQSLKSIL